MWNKTETLTGIVTALAVSGGSLSCSFEWDVVSNAVIFEPRTFAFPMHKIIVSWWHQQRDHC